MVIMRRKLGMIERSCKIRTFSLRIQVCQVKMRHDQLIHQARCITNLDHMQRLISPTA